MENTASLVKHHTLTWHSEANNSPPRLSLFQFTYLPILPVGFGREWK